MILFLFCSHYFAMPGVIYLDLFKIIFKNLLNDSK